MTTTTTKTTRAARCSRKNSTGPSFFAVCGWVCVAWLATLAVQPAHSSFVRDFYELLLNDGDDDVTAVEGDLPEVQPGDIFVSGRIRIKVRFLSNNS
jgi:hypothetical protein